MSAGEVLRGLQDVIVDAQAERRRLRAYASHTSGVTDRAVLIARAEGIEFVLGLLDQTADQIAVGE